MALFVRKEELQLQKFIIVLDISVHYHICPPMVSLTLDASGIHGYSLTLLLSHI